MLEEAIDRRIELVLPDVVLDELERVLTEKLGFNHERARAACDLLVQLAAGQPTAPDAAPAVTGDPADDLILARAVGPEVDIVATGDKKHLLRLGDHRGIRLLSPQLLLAELRR